MRQAVGVAVFFGMIGVTLFGLIFTPIFYMHRPQSGRPLVAARSRRHRPAGHILIGLAATPDTIGVCEIYGQPQGYKISCRNQNRDENIRTLGEQI